MVWLTTTAPMTQSFMEKLHAEKVMPFLRLETASPSENEKITADLKAQLEKEREETANRETLE